MFTDQMIQSALQQSGSADGTNGAILVGGSGGVTLAKFYWHAVLDGDATQAAGRNIYHELPYIKLWARGATDSASHMATPQDKREYAREWAEFEHQQKAPIHPVQFLPGFSARHFRYCEEAELFTVDALVAATVNPELEELQETGRRWMKLLEKACWTDTQTGDKNTLSEVQKALAVTPKKRGGRVKGSKNKPKAASDAADA